MMADQASKVLVAGDYVLDHHIYEGQRHEFGDRRHRGVQEVKELGGAALIHYLLQALGRGITSSLGVAIENRMPCLPPGRKVHSGSSAYAVWKAFDREPGASPDKRVWRTEQAMGFGDGGQKGERVATAEWPASEKQPDNPEVVVLSDGGMGFRDDPACWPAAGVLDGARWIVLKTSAPLATGPLWKTLTEESPRCRDKLVVVISSSDLRKGPARIGAGLSWDDTVETIIAALAPNEAWSALTQCRHLIIAFSEAAGCLWLDVDPASDETRAHLVYNASTIEGEDPMKGRGRAFGALSCLTAAVAWTLTKTPRAPDLETALEQGLSAIYDLIDRGHGRASVPGKGFPAERLASTMRTASCRYARAVFPSAHASSTLDATTPGWSLAREMLRQQGFAPEEPLWELAERVALRGPIALGSMPHLAVGHLVSADRTEVESLRILCQLIRAYQRRKHCGKPLSIGVFGPPGSGKSFAVKQIAQTLMGKDGWLEFNLSQFKPGTDDLIGAFHQIRDGALRGHIPVAFFDEFDSRNYEWLQYLLAPMQDGAFQEGQITHPIGKCLFVFAGGTGWTFDTFGPPQGDIEACAHFRAAKGPDFKSRLDGFMDVLGPNRRTLIAPDPEELRYVRKPDPHDVFYPVRRALMLRAELGCNPVEKLNMDEGLLRALLRAETYTHGARSLSKVLDPFKAVYPGRIHCSLLPPRRQLALHMDADAFIDAAARPSASRPAPPDWAKNTRDQMAAAIHETWRVLGRDQGWLNPDLDCAFAELTAFHQDSNRAAADRMASTLDLVGLALVPGKVTEEERERVRLRIEYNLEVLAEAEHEGWMNWHLDQGWQWGPERDFEKNTHPCLKPYIRLAPEERNKDWDSIRHYQEYAAVAGFKIKMKTQIQEKGRNGDDTSEDVLVGG